MWIQQVTLSIFYYFTASSGWGLEFGHSPSARRVMFIDGRRNQGHPPSGVPRAPSGGPCQSLKTRDALYKHGPPGGGRARLVTASINMALLAEGGRVSSRLLDMAPLPEGATTTFSGWGIRSPFDTLSSEVGIRETLTRTCAKVEAKES